MSSKLKLLFSGFIFLVLAVLPVLAQDFAPPATPSSSVRQRFPTGSSPKQKRELLQQRLQLITDAKKANLVLTINDKLTALNTKATQQMTDALNKMANVLDRLGGKLQEAKTQGLDTSLADPAFTQAADSLKVAQDAVASQEAKVYSLDASDSATLRGTVGKAVSQLQADLRAVHSLVIEAKHKIAALIRELAKTGVGKIGQQPKNATAEPALMRPVISP